MNKTKFFKLAGAAAMQAKQDKSFVNKVRAAFRIAGHVAKGNYNPSWSNLMITAFVLLYLISPIDFLPEMLLGPFGFIDDLGILMFGFKYFDKEIMKYLNWEMTQARYADVEDAKIIE